VEETGASTDGRSNSGRFRQLARAAIGPIAGKAGGLPFLRPISRRDNPQSAAEIYSFFTPNVSEFLHCEFVFAPRLTP
jgi:hypothetical protein